VLAQRIERDFGGFDAFRASEAATTQFGSGWAWLCIEGDKLSVRETANAEVPFAAGATPRLTVDVWEHAYYLDYRNRRADYIAAWFDKLANWRFAAETLAKVG
jgi:Fe-Mn family superoxide dismutase